MKLIRIIYILMVFGISVFGQEKETANEILQKTITVMDTIQTIYYKQDMRRTNPRDVTETIFRYREMYFQRLLNDSIVGVKGHWYFYNKDKNNILYEDIYDGNRLIRKNNKDSVARVYDLIKYPKFKEKHFWSHNTPFTMQYTLKHVLDNEEYYQTERLKDTIVQGIYCFQIKILLENKATMPGFAIKLEDSEGSISTTFLLIDKQANYPVKVITENYATENPEQKFFVDQTYYDLKFNMNMDESVLFNTSEDVLSGFEIDEQKP